MITPLQPDPDLMIADEVLVWVFVPEYESGQIGWEDAVRVAKEREEAEVDQMRAGAVMELRMEAAVQACRQTYSHILDSLYQPAPLPEWHSSKFPHN